MDGRSACNGVGVELAPDRIWNALRSNDPRFDGAVFCAITSTGIYCRPSCPARTPKRENVRFFPTAAAAQAGGFRACKRCRPDATPGSPEWDARADVVGRAMRMIADGTIDREGVPGLARRLGYSERHVHRQLRAVVGAGPLELARAQRAQTARLLVESTDLPLTEIAFAAGFSSVRQFNATVQEVYATTPSALRARPSRRSPARPAAVAPVAVDANGTTDGPADDASRTVALRLPYRPPWDADGVLGYLAARAVAGVETVIDGAYTRSLRLPHGPGVVKVRPADGYVAAEFCLSDLRDLPAAVRRVRALLDLDADPQAIVDALGDDPLLGSMVRATPGRRVPGHVDAHEQAVRAVLGQQVSIRGAATLAARLTATYGEPLAAPVGGVTHLFPSAEALADADPTTFGMPRSRAAAIVGLASALASGDVTLDIGSERLDTRERLLALPGVGPWTAGYVQMRALRDPDVFLGTDLVVRKALERLGQDARPVAAERLAERWRPYRSYATQHLWASMVPVPLNESNAQRRSAA